MKTIIAGSRSITDIIIVYQAIEASGFDITTVVSGCARGVDVLGEKWANNEDIPVIRMPAGWSRYGKGAGKFRNIEMALIADALVAVWDGVSRGTGHMIDTARAKGLKIYVHLV